MTYVEVNGVRIDNIVAHQLDHIRKEVLDRDKDKCLLVDGREGSGKSKFARQLAKALDPNFNIDKIAFNAEQFFEKIKSPDRKKGDCILLDEAYNASSSRGSMSEVNRAMVGLGTEMRQLNLFTIVILPTFFDLDKYFAIWRCSTLFSVKFREDGSRGYYKIYPFDDKLQLYIRGKKFYNYNAWGSPYPICKFPSDDPVDEEEYKKRKLEAFRKKKEKVTVNELKWKERLFRALSYFKKEYSLTYDELGKIMGIDGDNVKVLLGKWISEEVKKEKHSIDTPFEQSNLIKGDECEAEV